MALQVSSRIAGPSRTSSSQRSRRRNEGLAHQYAVPFIVATSDLSEWRPLTIHVEVAYGVTPRSPPSTRRPYNRQHPARRASYIVGSRVLQPAIETLHIAATLLKIQVERPYAEDKLRYCHESAHRRIGCADSLEKLEAPPGFEPGMEVLQTSALPLGHGAVRGLSRYRKTGAGNGIRTRDFDLGKVALYH